MQFKILDFKDMVDRDNLLKNILVGNGFSIWFSSKFQYGTLLENSESLGSTERLFFKELETSNFEACLNSIDVARKLNQLYQIHDSHDKLYEKIKNSLIESVRKVHIESLNEDKVEAVKFILERSTNFFSTNYDLILYWIVMKFNYKKHSYQIFGDSFNREEDDDQVYFSKRFAAKTNRKIFFLHGALHLFEEKGKIKKIQNLNERILDKLERSINEKKYPIFVSEGNWELKKKAIDFNPYLRYCYENLESLSGALTIVGHGLDEETDKHIITAINNSKITDVYYGIFKGEKPASQINIELAKVNHHFSQGKKIHFFDVESLYQYASRLAFGSL